METTVSPATVDTTLLPAVPQSESPPSTQYRNLGGSAALVPRGRAARRTSSAVPGATAQGRSLTRSAIRLAEGLATRISLLEIVATRHSQQLKTVEAAERAVTGRVGALTNELAAFAFQLQQALAAADEKVTYNLSTIEGTFNQCEAILS